MGEASITRLSRCPAGGCSTDLLCPSACMPALFCQSEPYLAVGTCARRHPPSLPQPLDPFAPPPRGSFQGVGICSSVLEGAGSPNITLTMESWVASKNATKYQCGGAGMSRAQGSKEELDERQGLVVPLSLAPRCPGGGGSAGFSSAGFSCTQVPPAGAWSAGVLPSGVCAAGVMRPVASSGTPAAHSRRQRSSRRTALIAATGTIYLPYQRTSSYRQRHDIDWPSCSSGSRLASSSRCAWAGIMRVDNTDKLQAEQRRRIKICHALLAGLPARAIMAPAPTNAQPAQRSLQAPPARTPITSSIKAL